MNAKGKGSEKKRERERELKEGKTFFSRNFRALQRPKKYSGHEILLRLRRRVVIAIRRNGGMALTVQMFGVGLLRPEGLLVN